MIDYNCLLVLRLMNALNYQFKKSKISIKLTSLSTVYGILMRLVALHLDIQALEWQSMVKDIYDKAQL